MCRTTFALHKLHNLTKILLIAHIAQLNFSRSNFYSNGEITKFEYYCLGSILTDYSFKLTYVFFNSNFHTNSKLHHINGYTKK